MILHLIMYEKTGYAFFAYLLPPGTNIAMLLPLRSILPWCFITISESLLLLFMYSIASSMMTLTKSSKPIKVPVNSLLDCSMIHTDWLMVLSIISKGNRTLVELILFVILVYTALVTFFFKHN